MKPRAFVTVSSRLVSSRQGAAANTQPTTCTCGGCHSAQVPPVRNDITADEWDARAAAYEGQSLDDSLADARRVQLRQMADDARYLAKLERERQEREAVKRAAANIDYVQGIMLP